MSGISINIFGNFLKQIITHTCKYTRTHFYWQPPSLDPCAWSLIDPGFSLDFRPTIPILGLSFKPVIKVIMGVTSHHLGWEGSGLRRSVTDGRSRWVQAASSDAESWLFRIRTEEHSTECCISSICDSVFATVGRWPKSPTRWWVTVPRNPITTGTTSKR